MRERIEYKNSSQIRAMRKAGLVVAAIHQALRDAARPGVSTAQLDAVVAKVTEDAGARPSFLGYQGFPATVCISVNDEIVHGIPGPRRLEAGDVVSLDCGAIVDGWHGDAAITVCLEGAEPANQQLSQDTEAAMWAGIAAVAKGDRVGDIGAAIEDYVEGTGRGYGIIREYVGHGIGRAMHQPPEVLNYRSRQRGARLRQGICLAIEPMLVRGGEATKVMADDWTVKTADGAYAAHWEHTVAVHEGGIWVLTSPDGGREKLAALGVEIAPLD